jgi:hypothetical protein
MATVRDHLNVIDPTPDWVVSLGEMIQQAEGCSTAIAASRARDLSHIKGIGEAVEGLARGWDTLMASDLSALTPLQRETIELLVLNITSHLKEVLMQAGRNDR